MRETNKRKFLFQGCPNELAQTQSLTILYK